jgi:Mlc titration factor MtfA (ptsG expression regulator)
VAPFPKAWHAFLNANVFHYQLLNKAERKRLRSDTWTFIGTKDWEGCRGLAVTDEMKVTIAAQACLMLLAQEHDYFGRVRSVLIYPAGFRVEDERWQDEGWTPIGAIGQAIHHGPVILAWDRVLAEGRDVSAGRNIVIHEFAHQLDFMDGYADGTIELLGEMAEQWQEVLKADYNRLRREVRRGRDTFLGDYAATNKSEFFATASERFFTQPAKLRHYHAELYQMLKIIYAIKPAKWFARHR